MRTVPETFKMAATVGSEGGFERADMARFRPGGLALLPWTKQMLTVLWSQLRLLVQVIYYTFMSGKNLREPRRNQSYPGIKNRSTLKS